MRSYVIRNGFGVKKSVSLIFESTDDLITDKEMNDDAKLIYNLLITYIPTSTYFELIKLMRGNFPINETKK